MATQLSVSLVVMEGKPGSKPECPAVVRRKSGRSKQTVAGGLDGSSGENSPTMQEKIGQNKRDSMEEKSGNTKTFVPESAAAQRPPAVVRRKPGRPPKGLGGNAQPALARSPLITSPTTEKINPKEDISGDTNKACLPETTGNQVVRRKPGRPPKCKKNYSDLQPARPMDCNIPVNSNTIGGLTWPQGRSSPSKVPPTSLTGEQPGSVRRKPGRPPKQKNTLITDAVKQDRTGSTPHRTETDSLPICIPTQNDSECLVSGADGLSVTSATPSQAASVSEPDGAEGLKRKRGRPKKRKPTPACQKMVVSFASCSGAEAEEDPSRSPTNQRLPKTKRRFSSRFQKRLPRQGNKNVGEPSLLEPDQGSLSGPASQQHAELSRKVCSRVADDSGVWPPKTNGSMDVNGSDGSLSGNHTGSWQSTGTVKNNFCVKEKDAEIDLNRLYTNMEGNDHKSAQSVDQTEGKPEFPSSIDLTNTHHPCNTFNKNVMQPITSMDPNKSRHSSLECSRYGRKRSLKGHLKRLKLDQGSESEHSSDEHPLKGTREERFQCRECDRSYKFKSQYILHERSHTGEKPFHCHVCGKRFGKNSNLNLHLKTQHKSTKSYKNCPKCKNRIHCSKYSAHVKMECNKGTHDSNLGSQASKKRKANVCQYCGKRFAYKSALERHTHVHTGSKPHKCDVCGKGFCQQYFLCVHQLTHWSENRYNCIHCKKSFTEYLKAKNHVCSSVESKLNSYIKGRSKASLSYTCDICKSTFFLLKDFHRHVKAHSSAKLHHCLMCGKLFSLPSEYNTHRYYCKKRRAKNKSAGKLSSNQHSQLWVTGPNSLTSVPASNSDGEDLSSTLFPTLQLRHQERAVSSTPSHSTVIPQHRSHFVSKLNNLDDRSDPRKYLCPHCGRLFRHMGRLRAHMLTHARGQSYTCGGCGKTLASWTKLWQHQRLHRQERGRFTCPQCGQGFRFVGPYKRHMAGHPEYRWVQRKAKKRLLPFQCELCCASFETLDLLFSHQACHFSGVRKVKELTSSLGHCPERTPSPSVNHALPHSEPQCSDFSPSRPIASHQESVALKYPHHSFHSSHPVRPIDPPLPGVVKQAARDATVGDFPTLKGKQRPSDAAGSGVCDGSPEDIRCVVCGRCYPAIPELYLHYLQHARGQL